MIGNVPAASRGPIPGVRACFRVRIRGRELPGWGLVGNPGVDAADLQSAPQDAQVASAAGLTESCPGDWASGWASILQSNPELAALVEAWPSLPEPVRAGIVAMIEAASNKRSRR